MRLVLVDAANCLYRAFFALPPLRSAEGVPTNALLGFTNMLNKAIREEAPDYLAVVFDAPGKSFRHELYPDYKATRDAPPEDLSAQVPLVREVIEAYRIPALQVPGVEADDVIASLVARAPEDLEVVILSTDKDLMQLVSDRVVLVDTMKDRRLGPEEVRTRFGVAPERVLDVRALVGDPSDNIPGVKGIGEKGAAKLIARWGDLDTLLAHAGEVEAKRAREALRENAEAARLSARLATLRRDVDLPVTLEDLRRREPDHARLRELFRRLGLRRLEAALPPPAGQTGEPGEAGQPGETGALGAGTARPGGAGETGSPEAAAPAPASRVARGAEALEVLAAEARRDRPATVVLLEGTPPVPAAGPVPFALALATGPEQGVLIVVEEEVREGLAALFARPWIARDTCRIQYVLGEWGIAPAEPAFDVELAAFLLDPAAQRTTEGLAAAYLGREVRPYAALAGRGARAAPVGEIPEGELAAWAVEEACALRELHPLLARRLEDDGLADLLRDVELPLAGVLARMQSAGVRVDEELLARLSQEYEKELGRIEGEIHQLAGEPFLVSSPKQLQRILFEKLRLPVVKKTKTGYSTDESVLEQLAAHHELPQRILAYRRLAKLKNTYVDALPPLVNPQTGRIHPTFHQTGAATGRLSCSNPNLQNIPIRSEEGVRIREAFVPAEGRLLLSADYSQVELRILAHFSGDGSLIEAFSRGEDVHRRTAAEVAGIAPEAVDPEQRARAKAINFGIIYGSSAFGIAGQLGIATADAQETIDTYFRRYRGVRRFLDETVVRAREEGFVRTLLGRRRYLPDVRSRNRVLRAAAERMAVNTVIQGTAADLIKKAMVEVDAALVSEGFAGRLLLQVHDELVLEAPESEAQRLGARVAEIMQGVYALEVPLVVDVGMGRSWREAH